jgi:hypothetical protein
LTNQAFINGDKLPDLVTDSGAWLSRGDGNYDPSDLVPAVAACEYTLDFNGDGLSDCLPTVVVGASNQSLYVGDGSTMRRVSNFNLTTAGNELLQLGNYGKSLSSGMAIGDVDSDGRSDIIRWKDDSTQNVVYLSNGDGTFTPAGGMGLAGMPLQKSDGSYKFLTGNFTGSGGVEILRIKKDATGGTDANSNMLFIKSPSTPPDQLASVVSGTGLKTSLTWVLLNNSSSGTLVDRYKPDFYVYSNDPPNSVAKYPVVDINESMYVVATATTASAAGDLLQTSEYSYGGLKTTYDGRGMLGFRVLREQTNAPNGGVITVSTTFSQSGRYVGKPVMQVIQRGRLNESAAPFLNRTSFVYCDTTSADPQGAAAYFDRPCPTTAKVIRPYLRGQYVDNWDANSVALPRIETTNTVNSNGDATNVIVSHWGTTAGLAGQVSTQTVSNTYYPDNIAGDNWILGQVQRSTVTNNVPNNFDSITAAAPLAPPPLPPTPPPASAPWQAVQAAIIMLLLDD